MNLLKLWAWEESPNAKPYFVNEEGWEWFVNKGLTRYLKQVSEKSDLHKAGLKGIVAFDLRKGTEQTHVLVNADTKHMLHEGAGYEDICCKIDILAIA